jgi:hypothetical protein
MLSQAKEGPGRKTAKEMLVQGTYGDQDDAGVAMLP